MVEYAVVDGASTGNTLDFSLSDSYTQETSRTADFLMKNPVLQSLNEKVSADDSFNRSVNYFRQEDEKLVLSDDVSKELKRLVEQSFSVNEEFTRSVNYFRSETEGTGLNSVYSREASYLRSEDESINFNDVAVTEGKFLRDLNATVSLNDVAGKKIFIVRTEESSFSDAVAFALERVLREAASVDEFFSREADYFRSVAEVFTFNEVFDPLVIQFLNVTESLSLNEDFTVAALIKLTEDGVIHDVFSREADYFRDLIETPLLNDVSRFSLSRSLSEEAALNEFRSVSTSINVSEDFVFSDEVFSLVGKSIAEDFSLNDVLREKRIFTRKNEGLGVDGAESFVLARGLEEAMFLTDVFSRETDYFRGVSEDLVLTSSEDFVAGLAKTEGVGLTDEKVFKASKSLQEDLSLNEVFGRETDYFRTVEENVLFDEFFSREAEYSRGLSQLLGVNDKLSKELSRRVQESFSLNDEFDFFFSEGPGTPPYFVRNSFVQGNSVQNQFAVAKSIQNLFVQGNSVQNQFTGKSIQNLFDSLDISNAFGDNDQR